MEDVMMTLTCSQVERKMTRTAVEQCWEMTRSGMLSQVESVVSSWLALILCC